MGIIEFLKGIFAESRAETPAETTEEVPLSNLEEWYAGKEKQIYKRASSALEQSRPDLLEAVRKCEQKLGELKSAQPRYPQLYARNKPVAEGNRAALSVAVANFLKTVKAPNSVSEISGFVQNFEKSIGSFMKESNRAFVISNEFFTEEATQLKQSLQELDRAVQKLKQHCEESNLAELLEAKNQVAELARAAKQSGKLEAKLKELEVKIAGLQQEKKRAEDEKAALFKSKIFSERQEMEKILFSKKADIRAMENHICSMFADIDTPLRKLAWSDPDCKKLVYRYLANLPLALSTDRNFEFAGVLSRLKSSLESGEIALKGRKKELALRQIRKLSRAYLQEWVAKYKRSKSEAESLQKRIENSAAAREEQKLKAKSEKITAELESLNRERASAIKAQKKINLEAHIEKASQSLQALLGCKIKIRRS